MTAGRPLDDQDGPDRFDDDEPAPGALSGRKLIIEADGGSRGNPGPGGVRRPGL